MANDVDFSTAIPWAGMRRCILAQNGAVVGYLDKDNSNKWEDGTDVNWTTVENNVQNVMVEIPKFYYCKKVIHSPKEERIFGVSDKPIETDRISVSDWKIHPAFYRARDVLCDNQSGVATEVDYRYAPAFLGWKDGSNRLRSLPNKSPTTSITIGTGRGYAKNMGNGWSMMDYNLLYAIQILYITEYGHPDSQTKIGRGYIDGNSGKINTGGTLQYGNNSYGETTGKKQMSYRGIEDFYGNCRYWIDGLYSDSSYNILIGNKGYNDTGAGYVNVGKGGNANVGGNIRDVQDFEEAGFIIKTTDSNTNYNTGCYDNGYLYSSYLPLAGADWIYGSDGGAFMLRLVNSASFSTASLAAALSF